MLNKPQKVICSSDDPQRIRVIDLIDDLPEKSILLEINYMSEGLILVTNDGELANSIVHHTGLKKYHVWINKELSKEITKLLKV